jgi:AhpD family alkylhydroperoxidase
MSRLAPGRLGELGIFTWVGVHVAGWVAGIEPPKLFLILGKHRKLFWGWLVFAYRLMPGGRLARRETELVILRVAHLRACDYERVHHERLARRAGISSQEIEALAAVESFMEAPLSGWSKREAAILAATDSIVTRHELSDAAWEALRSHLDDRELIELCMLVGHYDMLATTIGVLGIEPDRSRREMQRAPSGP